MAIRYFFFDCEMGGTNPDMTLLTLWGMVLDENLQLIDSIDLKIKPDNGRYLIDAYSIAVNKIDIVAHNEEAISETDAARKFYNFAFLHGGETKMIAAGHNLSLDIRYVKRRLLRDDIHPDGHCWGRFFSHRRIDTASIAQFLCLAGKLPRELTCSLQSLAEYFGFSYEGAHEAEFDTVLALKVLKKLVGLVDGAPLY